MISRRTGKRTRLAIVTSHPIQYYAPLFKRLAARSNLDLHVFYGWNGALETDRGFAREVAWDVPLLDGYEHTFVPNESRDPGTHHRGGIASSRLVPTVEQWAPDAIMVHGWAFHSHLAAMRAFHGRVPVLFRGDSTLLGESRGPRRWLRRTWLRHVYRQVDVALYAGVQNRRYFEAHGVRGERLEWAPPSVDNDRFHDPHGTLARDAAEWRTALAIPPDATTILFAGKLDATKSPELLLDAFMRGNPAQREHLIFVGSGPLEQSLRAAAADRPNVHFAGFQNQRRMPVAYRLGDVFVLPSQSETWGLAVNEAMASGRAVVASDRVGCAADLVREGETGFVFPSGDAAALRAALDRACTPDARATLGARGEALIREWSIDATASRIEGTVDRVTT
ncbi:MAG: glycosyltransferase [Gemmatimonadetes bacterium]|nr:glycosyltransferase [Gemmatimonadota bacterium]